MRASVVGVVSILSLAACRKDMPSPTRDATAAADLAPADTAPPRADGAPADSTPPTDVATPPTDVATAPTDVATAPTDVATAPVDAAAIPGCPGADAYVGNSSWTRSFEVAAPGVRRCAYWVESNGLTSAKLLETFAKKAIASVAPGRYPVLGVGGAPAPFRLPFCFLRGDGSIAAPATGTISARGAANLDVFLPLAGQGVVAAGLQGTPLDLRSLWVCQDDSCLPGQITTFVPCQLEGLTTERHKVQLEGGQVDLEVGIDRRGGGLGTEAAELTRASGTWKGVAFDQRDYFKLVYSPEHHHFVRHFAVLFAAPIAGACGLWLENIVPRSGISARGARVFTIDCQLKPLAEVKLTAAVM